MALLLVAATAIALLYPTVLLLWHLMRRRAIARTTGLLDLPQVGQACPDNKKIKGTAVICGGSIAGILTARICHDHYERVVIVEPEAWLATEDGRKVQAWTQGHRRSRVMQYYSLQGVQVFSLQAYKQLFPHFEDECKASDIRILAADFKGWLWGHSPKVPYEQYGGNLPTSMFTSRRGLETILRRLLLKKEHFPNIHWIVGTATAVSADSNESLRLNKVTVRLGEGSRDFDAALVVDCSGSAGIGAKLIERAGYLSSASYPKGILPADELKISYDQKMHYVTFEFTLSPEVEKRFPPEIDLQSVPTPLSCLTDYRDKRSFYIARVDGSRLHVCCGVWGDGSLPRTLQDLKEYTETLITDKPIPQWWPKMLDVLFELEDSMTCSPVRVPPTTYTRYQLAANLPSNFIAIGDSVMRINPVFGQGCAKALFGAVTLNTMLHSLLKMGRLSGDHPPMDFSHNFFVAQAAKIEPLWTATKIYDYGYDETVPVKGETLSVGSLNRWFMRRMQLLACEDAQAGSTMWHTNMFLAPSIDWFHPLLVAKMLFRTLLHNDL